MIFYNRISHAILRLCYKLPILHGLYKFEVVTEQNAAKQFTLQ